MATEASIKFSAVARCVRLMTSKFSEAVAGAEVRRVMIVSVLWFDVVGVVCLHDHHAMR